MQLLRSSQGPSRSAPLRPGSLAAHSRRHSDRGGVASDAEGRDGGETGGEGRGELEGRVRILLGVLERERRGREEERQRIHALEVALEEALVSCGGVQA